MRRVIAWRTSALLVLVLLSACTSPAMESTVPRSSASPGLSASATPSQTIPAAASASVSPTATGPPADVRTSPLGLLSGNWLFFTRRVPDSTAVRAQLEIWGLPEGGTPRRALSYTVSIAGAPGASQDNNSDLRRQFAPDGRGIVVSTEAGLTIVDLASGDVRALGVGGAFPSWSKDGSTIAYLAPASHQEPVVPPEDALWVVPARGGSPRELITIGYSSLAPEWSPDSSTLLSQLRDGVGFVDVATGHEVPGSRFPQVSLLGAHWRGDGAAVLAITDATNARLATFIASTTPLTSLQVRDSECKCSTRDPRWNPSGNGEVLVVVAEPGIQEGTATIFDTRASSRMSVVSDVMQATWSADGSQVLYIEDSPIGGGAIRAWDRTRGGSRQIVAAFAGAPHLSLATVSY